MNKISNIIWGLIFIAAGVILSLNALDIIDFKLFFDGWWTLFIIVPSFVNLFNRDHHISSFFFLVIGISLLLVCQDVISISLLRKLFFPFILIIIGLSIIYHNTVTSRIKAKMSVVKKGDKEIFTSFASQDYDFNHDKFEGCNVDTVFAYSKINLKETKINSDIVIRTSNIFGKTTLVLPEDINVKVTSFSLFGGTENKYHTNNKDSKYTIYIDTTNIFGGLEIL